MGWSMRAVILLLSVFLAIGIVYWQAPEIVPAPMRAAINRAAHAVLPQAAKPAAAVLPDQPVWPDAMDKPVRKSLPQVWMFIAGGLALLVIGAGLWLMRFLGSKRQVDMSPPWLAAARTLAHATNDSRVRLAQCDLIEKRLVSDMRSRGEAALARAHQLDLYWRYVGLLDLLTHSIERAQSLVFCGFRKANKNRMDVIDADKVAFSQRLSRYVNNTTKGIVRKRPAVVTPNCARVDY